MTVSTKTLTILNLNKSLSFKSGSKLLDILNANNININQSCGANGSCTTCRVLVLADTGQISAKADIELERSNEMSFSENERLACQTILIESVSIEIPEQN